MPSIERPLSGDVLLYDLDEEQEIISDPAIIERSGRNARTLIKSGPIRVTMIVVGAGGKVPEHAAEGPITVQPVEGRIRLMAQGRSYALGPGELLSLGPGIPHSIGSEEGAAFLLTIARAGAKPDPSEAEEAEKPDPHHGGEGGAG